MKGKSNTIQVLAWTLCRYDSQTDLDLSACNKNTPGHVTPEALLPGRGL